MSNTVVETKLNKPKLRFKDANGNDFPDWVEISLRKVLKERNEYSTKDNGYTHISLTKSGVVPKTERYNRDFLVTDDLSKNYKVTRLNDLCYNPANLKFGVICLNKWGTGIFSPIYVTFEIIDQNIDFIGYYLTRNSFINKARKYEQGTVYERMAVSPADLLKVKVFLPVLQEQQKIADFLMSVDNWIDNLKAQKESLEKYKKGMMQKIFSREIRFKDDNGNDFPDWEIRKLEQIGQIVGGGTPDTTNNAYWNGDIEWFTPSEIKQRYTVTSARKITLLGLQNSSASILPHGSILVTSRATIGQISIAVKECTTNQGFQSIIVNQQNNNNLFIYYWLLHNKKELIRKANGSTFLEISGKDVKKIKGIFPSLQEQQKIADFLSSIDSQIELKQKQIENAQQWKKGLMQEMFV